MYYTKHQNFSSYICLGVKCLVFQFIGSEGQSFQFIGSESKGLQFTGSESKGLEFIGSESRGLEFFGSKGYKVYKEFDYIHSITLVHISSYNLIAWSTILNDNIFQYKVLVHHFHQPQQSVVFGYSLAADL